VDALLKDLGYALRSLRKHPAFALTAIVTLALGIGSSTAMVMRSMLVGVEPTDLTTYAATLVLFVVITVLACWIPARRAASLDPANALRSE
jgi:ABC-type antimicrobial peptide transport system permease subunit